MSYPASWTTIRRARLGTTLVFLGNGLGIGAWSIEIAELKARLGATGFEMGGALFALAVAALTGMGITGRLAQRYPVHRLCLLAALAFVISVALPGLATGIGGLAMWLVLFGASNGALDVTMNSRASLIESTYDTPIMSSFHAAWSLGGGIGAALAGGLVGYGWPPAHVLGLVAALMLVPMCFAARGGAMGAGDASDETDPQSVRRVASCEGRRWPPRLLALCVIAFCALLTEGALTDWMSIYLKDALGRDAGAFSIGFVAFSVGMFVGRLAGDRVISWLGRRRVAMAGASGAAAALAVVLAEPSLISAGIGFVVVGLGLANIVPITFSVAGATAHARPAGIAMAATTGYTGLLIGPVLIGGMTHAFTLDRTLWLLVGTMLLMAAIGAGALRVRGKRPS
ncbi:MFS transporter [Salinisphaera sp. Q1T1-3]|uniref:MFS transporter n=1 Tax=Salinisphaera sp. Q1T1-3 TaxID=2321229 RepID=UPI0011C39ABC|nr:MFS transporter [Salinisphaera sp. Q1T1-3]